MLQRLFLVDAETWQNKDFCLQGEQGVDFAEKVSEMAK